MKRISGLSEVNSVLYIKVSRAAKEGAYPGVYLYKGGFYFMSKKWFGIALSAALIGTAMCAIPAAAEEADVADKKVGICIYQFADNFMTLFRGELENYLVDQGFTAENITIQDGKNDINEQSNQIDAFIADGVDALIINLVDPSNAPTVTDKVVAAGIPLVYINREPEESEEQRWADNGWNVTYVGCDARQSGTYQGEIIADLGIDAIDFNGNGKVDYVMVMGDPANSDAQYRTEFSIKAVEEAGLEVNALRDTQIGNWQQEEGNRIVTNDLAQFADDLEVVFCNNDAMALGALEAIKAAGRTVGEDIYLVGVDALDEAIDDVIDGSMTGTVFNNHIAQADGAADAAIAFLAGEAQDVQQYCDYVKVTKENAEDIKALLQ